MSSRTTDAVLILFFIAIVVDAVAAQEKKKNHGHEPATFSENNSVWNNVPPAVLKVLLAREEVKDSMERADESERKNPEQLFRAWEIHLENPNKVDLLVMGRAPLTGADNDWFWLVRSPRTKPRVVLFVSTYTVELLVTRTNGCRDIRSVWSSPSATTTELYHFNGNRYTLWREWTRSHN